MMAAVEKGFDSAFGTILDSNITTLIAAFVLFYFGTGTIKGFAVTLSFGILSSMFSAIMLTRLMIVLWLRGGQRARSLPI
jgi:preprotein translocase subunit SecD